MVVCDLFFQLNRWHLRGVKPNRDPDLIFLFESTKLKGINHEKEFKKFFNNPLMVGLSTAGNILGSSVDRYEAVGSAIWFEKGSHAKVITQEVDTFSLAKKSKDAVISLQSDELKHIIIFAPGLLNGSKILQDIPKEYRQKISGGMAGDNYRFEDTYTIFKSLKSERMIIAVGLYGSKLQIANACQTKWKAIGAYRVVTKSKENIVYEVDGQNAIEIYRRYLKERISQLPNSSLAFPIGVRKNIHDQKEIVRVLMGISKDGGLIYAGDVPQGSIIRLLRTDVTNLLEGVKSCVKHLPKIKEQALLLAISCSARRSILDQFIDEEANILHSATNSHVVGFYSFGEIAPFQKGYSCDLHNQTMTITYMYEK